MSEQLREAFEVKANEIGMVLDCHFFESGNNYTDDDTRLAYSLFEAGWQAATAQPVPEGFVPVAAIRWAVIAGWELSSDGHNHEWCNVNQGDLSCQFDQAAEEILKAAQEQNHDC